MAEANATYVVLSATATATDTASPIQTNQYAKGGHFVINVSSAQGSTATAAFSIQGLVPGTTGTFYTILASSGIDTEGVHVLKVYPGLSTDANAVANDVLPREWRVSVDHTGTETLAWTVGAALAL